MILLNKGVGYIRVSTARQGVQGVSLAEQRDAIVRYAQRCGLEVVQWFEERETAAKRGRPVFRSMLDFVRAHPGTEVVVHKVDRSARNLSDWAELGDLIDQGINVRFANEDLDLRTRGGRLTADIQAVIAADYIRNLREETKKGMQGRLKQGVYPLPAPIGYVDQGAGKVKTPDPVTAPLVQRAFSLYDGGRHSFVALRDELHRLGLRNRRGGRVTRTGISVMLRNPFYIGLMRLKSTGDMFPGAHEPLVGKALFDRVQARLDGKVRTRGWIHDFLFRRLFSCGTCGYALVGERQKGHAYYRCHTRECPTKAVREEDLDQAVRRELALVVLTGAEQEHALSCLAAVRTNQAEENQRIRASYALRKEQLAARLERLTDVYLERGLDQVTYAKRKERLLLEEKTLAEETKDMTAREEAGAVSARKFFELISRPVLLYELALPDEKRHFVEFISSNRVVHPNSIDISLVSPFSIVAERQKRSNGAPQRDRVRTIEEMVTRLVEFFCTHAFPELDAWHSRLFPKSPPGVKKFKGAA